MNIITNSHNNSNKTRVISSNSSVGGVGGINNLPACAACKYQRRRCAPDCILAPYFPAESAKDFLNAHKLFGVSNMTKVLKSVKPVEEEIAMKTMIIQANVRASDPVGGCYRIIEGLQRQINYCKAELDLILQQLEFYRAQFAKNEMQNLRMATSSSENGAVNVDLMSVYDPIAQVLPANVDFTGSLDDKKSSVDESEDIKSFNRIYDERKPALFV